MFVITTLLYKRRIVLKDFLNIFISIVRSSLFLGVFAGGFSYLNCFFRNIVGRYTLTGLYLSGFFPSLVSILLEHPSRRKELALYTSQQSAEAIYNMLRVRGYIQPIKYADIGMFSIAMGILYYFYKYEEPPHRQHIVRSFFSLLLGDDPTLNFFSLKKSSKKNLSESSPPPLISFHSSNPLVLLSNFIFGFCRGFFSSYIFILAIRIISGLISKQLLNSSTRSKYLCNILKQYEIALFLGLMGSGFRGFPSLFHYLRSKDDGWNYSLSGLITGLSFALVRNTEVCMYFVSKVWEELYIYARSKFNFSIFLFFSLTKLSMKKITRNYIRSIPYGEIFLYAFTTALLFVEVVAEFYNLRPSYHRFVLEVTGGKRGLVGHFPAFSQLLRRDIGFPTPSHIQKHFDKDIQYLKTFQNN